MRSDRHGSLVIVLVSMYVQKKEQTVTTEQQAVDYIVRTKRVLSLHISTYTTIPPFV